MSSEAKSRTRGRLGQIPVFLGKFFRMFIFEDDWKVIPMATIISALIAFTVGQGMFKSMEGTLRGSLAMSCVCIWNGFFNSIQAVCRERQVVKREHRSGLHITSYVISHAIYQAVLCFAQAVVFVAVCYLAKMQLPSAGTVTPFFALDLCLSLFFLTFAADMIALFFSCLAKTTTGAMTLIPFILIFELLFSNSMFGVSGKAAKLGNFTIAKWGMNTICSQADYNNLPTYTAWNQLNSFTDVEYEGLKPFELVVETIKKADKVDEFCLKAGMHNKNSAFDCTANNIKLNWFILRLFAYVHMLLAVIALKQIDKDKR